MDLKAFFDMGGYAVYVWPSFAVTAVVLVLTWWAARRSAVDRSTSIDGMAAPELLLAPHAGPPVA